MFSSENKIIGRFFIADPGLLDDKGHHFTTSTCLAGCASTRGLKAEILASVAYRGAGTVRRVFSQNLYQDSSPGRLPLEAARRSGPLTDQNSIDLLLFGEQMHIDRSDVFMFHTATINFVNSLFEYFLLTPAEKLASFHFLFRYDPDTDAWAGNAETFTRLVTRLKSLGLMGRRVFFYAETDALAHLYSSLADVQVCVLYHFSTSRPVEAASPQEGPIRIGFFGEARAEKGFDAFHHAASALGDSLKDRATFFTQCYSTDMNLSPEIRAAHGFFWSENYLKHNRTRDILDDDEYGKELTACDVLVVPHRVPRYSRRGSGIFVDGVVHDKVMIVRSGTWMSHICPGELAVTFSHDQDLQDAILRAVEVAECRRRTRPGKNATRALFDVGANIQEVMRNHVSAMTAPPQARHLRVLHIAPFWIRQGSTRVYEAQLRALAELGATVMCVHIANFPIEADPAQSTYRWFLDQAPAQGAVHQWLVATHPDADNHTKTILSQLMAKPYSWAHEWAQSHTLEIPGSLAHFARQADIDLIVLNYAHNLPLVMRLGLADKPIIVETHDIRARQFSGLGQEENAAADEASEFAALRAASGVVFINRDEQEAAAAEIAGKPSITVLPSLPVPLDRAWVEALHRGHGVQRCAVLKTLAERVGPADRDRSALSEFYVALRQAGERPGRLVCFLGSGHHWNMVSLEWLHDQVFAPYLLRRGMKLVIAGTAAKGFTAARGRPPGVIALGEMDDITLLYEAGITFALPIRGGTGFPIKTLEALTVGSPVVGTSEAFRGFPDLKNIGAIEDEPLGFANALLKLADPGGSPPRPPAKPPILTWEHYAAQWAQLIQQVTGRTLPPPQPLPASARLDSAALAAISPLRPLHVNEVWRYSPETQADFLAASSGFEPSPSETEFCWSAENAVAFEISLHGPVRALEVSVPAVTLPSDGTPWQEAAVFVQGAYTGRLRLTEDSVVEIPLDSGSESVGMHRVLVEFILPKARYGLEFAGWRDARRLGFAISAIRLLR